VCKTKLHRKISGPKKDEASEVFGILSYEEIRDSYRSPHPVKILKNRKPFGKLKNKYEL
jgi:hypothetical protein